MFTWNSFIILLFKFLRKAAIILLDNFFVEFANSFKTQLEKKNTDLAVQRTSRLSHFTYRLGRKFEDILDDET